MGLVRAFLKAVFTSTITYFGLLFLYMSGMEFFSVMVFTPVGLIVIFCWWFFLWWHYSDTVL